MMALLKYIRQRKQFLRSPVRLFSLSTSESEHKLSKTKPSLSKKRANEVYDYMKSNDALHLFRNVPVEYFERKVGSKFILINPFIAKKISSALKLYLNESYVLESDPGLGLLTKELIHMVSYLRLYEEDPLLRSDLRELQKRYPTKIEIFDSSLRIIHGLQSEDSLDNGIRMSLLFDDIPTDIRLSMIMATPYRRFLQAWIHHVLNKSYFSKFNQMDFYFFIPPSIYTRLIATPQNDYYPRYQTFSVLAQILFDIELLMNDIPRKAFLPWPRNSTANIKKRYIEKYENDHEVMYFVRMSLKAKNLSHLQDENLYRCFFTFLTQNMNGKKRIVPYFETIIPGSGARVIMMGYNIYSTFNELNPHEIFNLFIKFTEWPEFPKSSFYSYWKNVSSIEDNQTSTETVVHPLHSNRDEEIVDDDDDDDDNDDDAFLPGNNVK